LIQLTGLSEVQGQDGFLTEKTTELSFEPMDHVTNLVGLQTAQRANQYPSFEMREYWDFPKSAIPLEVHISAKKDQRILGVSDATPLHEKPTHPKSRRPRKLESSASKRDQFHEI
jgi:hypothetical protein